MGDSFAAAPAGPSDPADPLEAWENQYPLPSESGKDVVSVPQAKLLYKPPRNDAVGVAIAATIITTWAALFYHACWQIRLGPTNPSPWWDVVGTFFALEFVNTGLFITTHDAMHGAVCFRNRMLNDALGAVAISCYAWFDYSMLHRKHWEHHGLTGLPGKDPDFHHGNPALLPWFARFMLEYSTPGQFARIFGTTMLLQALHVPYANLCVYYAAAPLLAAFRLFYYGTYLPHLPSSADELMHWEKSHSVDDPSWLSFFKCYHFCYHLEHHRWPYAPWWQLPHCKAISRRLAASSAGAAAATAAVH